MKGRTILIVTALLAATIASPATAGESKTCAEVSKPEIAALFDRWNASLQTGNAEKVADNYAPDAVLLPTVSNTPRTTRDGIKDYFEHFLQKKPKGKIDASTIHIGCDEAYDVGTYTFALTGKEGKVDHVAARYSFIYELRDGKWLIAHHHSSAMPEKTPFAH
ncbi:MAG: SgcJ/EcaC family oxidoreductase [Bdellovibrionales bacterium]